MGGTLGGSIAPVRQRMPVVFTGQVVLTAWRRLSAEKSADQAIRDPHNGSQPEKPAHTGKVAFQLGQRRGSGW